MKIICEKDKIIKTSIEEGKTINLNDTITIYVSKGIAVKVPDFSGNTKSEVQKECDNLGLSCSFTEEYSRSITSGKVIKQSVAAGTEISKGDKITITIATSKKNTSSTSNKTTSSTSSKRPSSGNTSNNTSRPSGGSSSNSTTTQKCETTELNIAPSWIKIGDPDATCSNIKSK